MGKMKHECFADIIRLLKSESLKEKTIEYLERVPEYFWLAPSSISGNHHPKDERLPGGLVLHSRRVALYAIRGARALDTKADPFIIASMTHDTLKYGSDDVPSGSLNQRHGIDAFELMENIRDGLSVEDDKLWAHAGELVLYHMGRFGPRTCSSIYCYTFHLADMYASIDGYSSPEFKEDMV
jgi:hypothetical protein